MEKKIALLIATTITMQGCYFVVQGTPVSESKNVADVSSFVSSRITTKNGRFIPDLPISWALPTFPSISVSSLFRNDEKQWKEMKERVDSLEHSHRRILGLLKKLNEALKLCDVQTTPTPLENIGPINTTTYSEVLTESPNGTVIADTELEIGIQMNPENEYPSGSIISIDLDDDEQRKLVIKRNKTENLDQYASTFASSESMVHKENYTLTESNKTEEKVSVIKVENETPNLTISLTRELKPDNVPDINNSKLSNIVPPPEKNFNAKSEGSEVTFKNKLDRKIRFPDVEIL